MDVDFSSLPSCNDGRTTWKKGSFRVRNLDDRFTIVMPNRNMDAYLAETIESVLDNLRDGDEFFVVDGASTDRSCDIISHYEKRITHWCSEPDEGLGDALAKGFSWGKNPLQCWINCGDLLLKGALNAAASVLNETSAELIYGDDFHIDQQGRVMALSSGKVRWFPQMMLYGNWTPLQDACFWRRSLYERVGGVDSSSGIAADYDLFLRFALRSKCAHVPIVFSAFRQHDGQMSINRRNEYRRHVKQLQERERRLLGVGAGQAVIMQHTFTNLHRVRARITWLQKLLPFPEKGMLASNLQCRFRNADKNAPEQ